MTITNTGNPRSAVTVPERWEAMKLLASRCGADPYELLRGYCCGGQQQAENEAVKAGRSFSRWPRWCAK